MTPSEYVKALEKRIDRTLEGCLKGRAVALTANTAYTDALILARSVVTWQENMVKEIKNTNPDYNIIEKDKVLNILSSEKEKG